MRSAALLLFTLLFATPSTFRYAKVKFTPADSIAFDAEGTVVALTSYKIDRPAVMAAIDPADALVAQTGDRGSVIFVRPTAADRCEVHAFLAETQQSVGLGHFAAKTTASTASRIAGECFTEKPEKMFDDEYEFHLAYDVPVTAIPKPAALPPGGGEAGGQYLALVKAIHARDWSVAHLHTAEGQLPDSREETLQSNYFENLEANYPKSATVTGGLMKGNFAQLDIAGLHHDGRKITGKVRMTKSGANWRVVDQYFVGSE